MRFTRFPLFSFIAVLLGACTHNIPSEKNTSSQEERYFKSVMQACNIKFSDSTYCKCFSRITTDKAIENNSLKIESTDTFVQTMFDSMNDINQQCKRGRRHLEIPEIEISSTLKRVLEENKGNILSPELVPHIGNIDKPKGWEYTMVPETITDFTKSSTFRYTGHDNEKEYFDWIYYVEPQPVLSGRVMYVRGESYYLDKKENPMVFKKSSTSATCKYVLGYCRYTQVYPKEMNTIYRDGMWIRNVQASRGQRGVDIDVYDKNGLPLYHMHQSKRNDVRIEKIRLERIKKDPDEYKCSWCSKNKQN